MHLWYFVRAQLYCVVGRIFYGLLTGYTFTHYSNIHATVTCTSGTILRIDEIAAAFKWWDSGELYYGSERTQK